MLHENHLHIIIWAVVAQERENQLTNFKLVGFNGFMFGERSEHLYMKEHCTISTVHYHVHVESLYNRCMFEEYENIREIVNNLN